MEVIIQDDMEDMKIRAKFQVTILKEIKQYTELVGIPIFVDSLGILYKKASRDNLYETIAEENNLGLTKKHLFSEHKFSCREKEYSVFVLGKVEDNNM